MGTVQQHELNPEKQTTKQTRKSIPFTDLSIKNWKPKKDKDKIGFPRHNVTRGLNVLYRKKTNQKYWELTYYLKKSKRRISLGPFIPGVNGAEQIEGTMLILISTHKDLRRTHWLTDPAKTIKEKDQKVVAEDKQKEDEIISKSRIKQTY